MGLFLNEGLEFFFLRSGIFVEIYLGSFLRFLELWDSVLFGCVLFDCVL